MVEDSYLKTSSAIRDAFWKNPSVPSVQLGGFLLDATYRAIRKEISTLAFSRDDDLLNHRYARAPMPKTLHSLFSSREFLGFVSFIVKKDVVGVDAGMMRFLPGDYALRHNQESRSRCVEIVLDLEGLPSGAGGAVVFVGGAGSYHAVPPSRCALSIVRRDRGVQRFVQYHNHYAKQRHLVLGELCICAGTEDAAAVAKKRGHV